MRSEPTHWFAETIRALVERRDLSEQLVRALVKDIIAGDCDEVEAGAVLIGLRMKGESAEEIAVAASILREHMIPLETGRNGVLDTCGTGGDGTGTFNISTAAAFVVAGAGVPVVKHGNRAVSSRSGSADVLAALGVNVEMDAPAARRCLDRAGLAFCLAPIFHPALRHIASLRRRLGVRTLFNAVGPLSNPAKAEYQLLGVGWPELLERMAGALAKLGTRRAILVCSHDGLDEVSLSAPTRVCALVGKDIRTCEWVAEDFGLSPCSLDELKADGPEESAAMIRAILAGEEGAPTRVVLANAAAALLAAGRVGTLEGGVAIAREAVASGKAREVLEILIACSHEKV